VPPIPSAPRASDALAPPPWGRVLLTALLVTAASHLLDPVAWELLRDPRVNEREWGRLLRSAGYVPTWLLGALAVWLAGRSRLRAVAPAAVAPAALAPDAAAVSRLGREAWMLALVPALAGGLAEVVKLAVRRLRPAIDTPAYAFRGFDVELWSTRGLGFASSHTAVAVGAAAVLARLFPGSAPVWYALAAGCALTRVMAGAHYVSDTVGAAVIGWLVAEAAWRWHRAREG
jgi:membrane-associated phospholipid phosphatase